MRAILFAILLLISHLSKSAEYVTDTLHLYSTILQEDRTVILFKPILWRNTDTLSLICFPDGASSCYYYDQINRSGQGQLFLGLGILHTNRRRDVLPTGEAEKYLEFLQHELIPVIIGDYNISNKILYGHSLEGGFCIYSMLRAPGLFNAYIASSPTPIMDMVDPVLYKNADIELSQSIRFYFSYGSKDLRQVRKWAVRLNNNLFECIFSKITWNSEVLAGKTHNNSAAVSLSKGIDFSRLANH